MEEIEELSANEEPKTALEALNKAGYYTAEQVAAMCGVSDVALRQAVHRNVLNADRTVKNIVLVHESEIHKFQERSPFTRKQVKR